MWSREYFHEIIPVPSTVKFSVDKSTPRRVQPAKTTGTPCDEVINHVNGEASPIFHRSSASGEAGSHHNFLHPVPQYKYMMENVDVRTHNHHHHHNFYGWLAIVVARGTMIDARRSVVKSRIEFWDVYRWPPGWVVTYWLKMILMDLVIQ